MTGAANAETYPGCCRILLEVVFYWGGCRELWNFFRQIGVFDLEEPQKKTMELTDEDWASEAWRQKSYPVHQQTQTISLIFDKYFRHSNPTTHLDLSNFRRAFAAVMQATADYDGECSPVAQVQGNKRMENRACDCVSAPNLIVKLGRNERASWRTSLQMRWLSDFRWSGNRIGATYRVPASALYGRSAHEIIEESWHTNPMLHVGTY